MFDQIKLTNDYQRKVTNKIKVGDLYIGGGERITIQSMTNTRTADVEKTICQINALQEKGCDIVRVAVFDEKDAKAISSIVKEITIPLVADIHFDYRLAITAIENGASKIRFNPGNIGSMENIKKLVNCAKEHKVPIRIGVNSGSLEKDLLEKFGRTPKAMVESALRHVKILEENDFFDIVVSVKSSSVQNTLKAYMMLSNKIPYPLHVGVTEAGTREDAIIKSSIGIGSLLALGIGDTIRVSITGDPLQEIEVARDILKGAEIEKNYAEIVSCPTCGRCQIDIEKVVKSVKQRTKDIDFKLKIAIMGCVVNGVGESADADIGLAGGRDSAVIFKAGKPIKTVSAESMVDELILEIDKIVEEKNAK